MIFNGIMTFLFAKAFADLMVGQVWPVSYGVQLATFWGVWLGSLGLLLVLDLEAPRRDTAPVAFVLFELARWAGRALWYGFLVLLVLAPVSCVSGQKKERTVEVVGEWAHRDTRLDCSGADCWDTGWCAIQPVLRDVLTGETFRAELRRDLKGRNEFLPYRLCDTPARREPSATAYTRAAVTLDEPWFGVRRVVALKDADPTAATTVPLPSRPRRPVIDPAARV